MRQLRGIEKDDLEEVAGDPDDLYQLHLDLEEVIWDPGDLGWSSGHRECEVFPIQVHMYMEDVWLGTSGPLHEVKHYLQTDSANCGAQQNSAQSEALFFCELGKPCSTVELCIK